MNQSNFLGNYLPDYIKQYTHINLQLKVEQNENGDLIVNNNKIIISKLYLKPNEDINNIFDFIWMLEIYDYWKIDITNKNNIIDYINSNNYIKDDIEKFKSDDEYFISIINYLGKISIVLNSPKLLKIITNYNCKLYKEYSTFCARKGYLDCLKILHKNNCPFDDDICFICAENGQLNCLIYSYENGYRIDEKVVNISIINKHLECFIFLIENDCKISKNVFDIIAMNGELAFLKYAHYKQIPWNTRVHKIYESQSNIECLEYLQKKYSLI
jgi:hypothetical protein